MPQPTPIETVRLLNTVFDRYDFVAVRDALETSPAEAPTSGVEELDRLVRESVASDFVLEFEGGGPLEESRHDGRNDWMSVWRRLLAAFESYTVEAGNYEQFGEDVVVVDVVHRGRGRGSGLEIEFEQTQVWQVQDGRLIYGGIFDSRANALGAAAKRTRDSD